MGGVRVIMERHQTGEVTLMASVDDTESHIQHHPHLLHTQPVHASICPSLYPTGGMVDWQGKF